MTRSQAPFLWIISALLIAEPFSDAILRIAGLPATLGLQIATMMTVFLFAPLGRRIPIPAIGLFLAISFLVLCYFVYETVQGIGLFEDRVGTALRCLTFARVMLSLNTLTVSPRFLAGLGNGILISAICSIVLLRASGYSASIRFESILLPLAHSMFMLTRGLNFFPLLWYALKALVCVLVIVLMAKSSMILAMGGLGLVLWPLLSGLGVMAISAVLALQFGQVEVLENLLPERIYIRIARTLEALGNPTREDVAAITSNRSEEFIFVFNDWTDRGFPIFGAGLSSEIYVDGANIWRSTMHNLVFNLIRIFGVFSALILGAVVYAGAGLLRNRLRFALFAALFLHNLLTFSLLHSALFYFIAVVAFDPSPRGRLDGQSR